MAKGSFAPTSAAITLTAWRASRKFSRLRLSSSSLLCFSKRFWLTRAITDPAITAQMARPPSAARAGLRRIQSIPRMAIRTFHQVRQETLSRFVGWVEHGCATHQTGIGGLRIHAPPTLLFQFHLLRACQIPHQIANLLVRELVEDSFRHHRGICLPPVFDVVLGNHDALIRSLKD